MLKLKDIAINQWYKVELNDNDYYIYLLELSELKNFVKYIEYDYNYLNFNTSDYDDFVNLFNESEYFEKYHNINKKVIKTLFEKY